MYEDPDDGSESPVEHALTPADRARDNADQFRMHAELAAVFEACRKFDAQIRPGLDPELARDIQKTIAKLDKAKTPDTPLIPPELADEAARLLNLPLEKELPTNDYHVHRRPGEVMIVRWLAGEEVDTFYERLQAHFDAALEGFKEDEHQANEWKQDPKTLAYLEALDAIEVKMADRYLRTIISEHRVFILSTQSADEMNIAYLADHVMSVPAPDLVGAASAPPDEAPTDQDLAWFFKLFALRGISEGIERMCFFTYMQKSDDSAW